MSFVTYVARRTLFALLAIYLVVTATFAVIAITPDTQLGAMQASMQRSGISQDVIQERVQAYKEARGLNDPMHVRYVDWLVDVTTLNFGQAHSMDAPTSEILWPAIQRTALYTIPALVFALLIGTLLGGLSGSLSGGAPDWVVRVAGYGTVGVPVFIMAYLLHGHFPMNTEWVRLLTWQHTPFDSLGNVVLPNHGMWPPSKPFRFLVPAVVFALALVGWQLRYVRTAYLDRASEESVKLLRAKGAGRLKIARHVLRNAAVPIVSASLSELLVVVLLNIYVIETVFGIEGIAALNMIGVRQRDMALVIGTSLVLAVGGVVASYAQDLLYGYLDPRIGTE